MKQLNLTAPPEVAERHASLRDPDVQAFLALRPDGISAFVDSRVSATQPGTRQLFKLVFRLLFLLARREFGRSIP